MYEIETEKSNLNFFKKIEESLKCNFKYTNMIVNDGDSKSADAEALALEKTRTTKIEKGLLYLATLDKK